MIAAPLKRRRRAAYSADAVAFRDLLIVIAAPLKRVRAATYRGRVLPFRDLLITAKLKDQGRRSVLHEPRSFRDAMITAPLKAVLRRGEGLSPVRSFRDPMITAPLKHDVGIDSTSVIVILPRSIDRGSIEVCIPRPPVTPRASLP